VSSGDVPTIRSQKIASTARQGRSEQHDAHSTHSPRPSHTIAPANNLTRANPQSQSNEEIARESAPGGSEKHRLFHRPSEHDPTSKQRAESDKTSGVLDPLRVPISVLSSGMATLEKPLSESEELWRGHNMELDRRDAKIAKLEHDKAACERDRRQLLNRIRELQNENTELRRQNNRVQEEKEQQTAELVEAIHAIQNEHEINIPKIPDEMIRASWGALNFEINQLIFRYFPGPFEPDVAWHLTDLPEFRLPLHGKVMLPDPDLYCVWLASWVWSQLYEAIFSGTSHWWAGSFGEVLHKEFEKLDGEYSARNG
jgi:hypothetical protein